jgi:disulfide bond formation protein DsbB
MNAPRPFYLAAFLLCAALLGFGYYLQFALGQEPCPLCIFQRIAFLAVTAVALVGAVHAPRGAWARIYSGLMGLFAAVGAGIAAWQVRLQYLPDDQVPECGLGLDYMLDVFPIIDVVKMAFTASGECAEAGWTFLSLSIAGWSLLWFLALTIAAITHAIRGRIAGPF